MPRKAATATADDVAALRKENERLRERITLLEKKRPGRKAKPMKALREYNICAIEPSRDSETCPDASIFRYQVGCHGAACRNKQRESYQRRKARTTKAVVETKVALPRKRVAKAKAAPVKPPVAKKSAPKKTSKVAVKR
jgi:hypothetical protein